jgi:hypothetical protein
MPFSPPPVFYQDKTSLLHQGSEITQLKVISSDSEADVKDGTVIYRGGVKAIYGVSVLTADVLIVRKGDPGDRNRPGDPAVEITEGGQTVSLKPFEATALGKVTVVDPDGTLKASNLWFTWNPLVRDSKTEVIGRAEAVEAVLSTSHINASSVTVTATGLNFQHVSFWSGNWRTPLFRFDAESVQILPGDKGVARQMKLSLLGVQLPPIPKYTFSLDPRSEGLNVPTIGYRQDAGVGLSWVGNIPINKSSNIFAALTAFPSVQPTYTLSYSKSNVPDDQIGKNQFFVSDQFGERSQFSFFETVYTPSLDNAYDRMRIRKNLFSVSSTFNYETIGRVTDRITNYSQPLEIGFENGGPAGNWAYLFQAKAARIVESGSRSASRMGISASAFSPLARSGRLVSGARFDGVARLDPTSSGYFGLEAGFSYEAMNKLTFSAGAYGFKSLGTPYFAGDTFQSNQGYVVRADWFGASTGISLMFRYDPTQGWFDREYRLSQVMGSVEPVLVYRAAPRQYVFGFKFRVQDISKMLQRRKLQRNNQAPGDLDK